MAVVKIHQIRSTLNVAVAYIVNEVKTNALVSTFECAPIGQGADAIAADFLTVQGEAEAIRTVGKRPTIQGIHIIQSFKPGETTAEMAHMIGQEFAEAITGGKHQWVLATHTDRGHLHNHLIFNPVNIDTLYRYRTPKSRLFEMREISDRICTAHGLSIIDTPTRDEAVPLSEQYARVRGASNMDHLRGLIDHSVTQSSSLRDLISHLKDAGVETTFRGRSMLVRDTHTMRRPVRMWRLGPAYSESNLAARLGQNPVVTFTVKPSMVIPTGEGMTRVAIPTMTGTYLAVPLARLVDHGGTWHMHLPDTQTTPIVDRAGNLQGAFTPEQLSRWFTPLPPERVIEPHRTQPIRRGKTDAQRRYYATIDRKVASLAERMEVVNLKAELARLTPQERIDMTKALHVQQQLRSRTLTQLVIDRDQHTGADKQAIEDKILSLQKTITTDDKTLKELDQTKTKEKHR